MISKKLIFWLTFIIRGHDYVSASVAAFDLASVQRRLGLDSALWIRPLIGAVNKNYFWVRLLRLERPLFGKHKYLIRPIITAVLM